MIICVGLNAAIDRTIACADFEVGSVCTAELRTIQPAGKATNVARILSALSTRCVLTGFVGEAEHKLYQHSFSNDETVDVRLTTVTGSTRINTTIIDSTRHTETHIREAGFVINSDDFQRFSTGLLASVNPGDRCVFCGSIPPGCAADAVAKLMQDLLKQGAWVGADLSGPLLAACRQTPLSLLKVNRDELAELVETALPSHDAAQREGRSFGAGLEEGRRLLLSDGAEGAGLFADDTAIWAHGPQVEVKNTVGAGDAFLAGFLAAEASAANPEDALRTAMGAGTSAVGFLEAGRIDVPEVRRFAENCTISSL